MILFQKLIRQLVIICLMIQTVSANQASLFCDENECTSDNDCSVNLSTSTGCKEPTHNKCVTVTDTIFGVYDCQVKKCKHPHKVGAACEAGYNLKSAGPTPCASRTGKASAIPKDSLIIAIDSPTFQSTYPVPVTWLQNNMNGIKSEAKKLLNCYGLSHIDVVVKDFSQVSSWSQDPVGLGYDLWYLRNSAIATINGHKGGVGKSNAPGIVVGEGREFYNIRLAVPSAREGNDYPVEIYLSWDSLADGLDYFKLKASNLKSQQYVAASIVHEYVHMLTYQVISSLLVKEESDTKGCTGLKVTRSSLFSGAKSKFDRWHMKDWHSSSSGLMTNGMKHSGSYAAQCINSATLDFSNVCNQQDACVSGIGKDKFFGLNPILKTDIVNFSKRRSATITNKGCFRPCLPP